VRRKFLSLSVDSEEVSISVCRLEEVSISVCRIPTLYLCLQTERGSGEEVFISVSRLPTFYLCL